MFNFSEPVVTIVGLSVLLVVSILGYILKSVMPVSQFIYSNARIQARSNYLISKNRLNELIESKTLASFISMLRDTEYADELEKVADKNNIDKVHLAIEKSFIHSIDELKKITPASLAKVFDAYIVFIEANILKTIFRQKFLDIKVDENIIYPVGKINVSLLSHLKDAQTVADLKVVMTKTIYEKLFEQKFNSIEEFDAAIDGFALENFISTVKKAKMHDSKFILWAVNTKVDIINILALLKLRIRKTAAEEQEKLIVKNNSELSKRIKEIVGAETLKDFVENFKNLPYYESMKKALELYEKDDSLFHFENELFKFYQKTILEKELSLSLGPYPLLAYLVKKEVEKRNLFIISRAITADIDEKRIKEMIA